MPRLHALDPENAGGASDPLLRTLAAAPDITASLQQHAQLVMRAGNVPELTKVLCAAMAAGLSYCQPSLTAHRRRARQLGAHAPMLSAIWDYASSDCFTPAQKAALAATVALTREPRALPDGLWNDLRAHYSDSQIVELLCVIGLANYLDRVSNALQTEMPRPE
ncbi:MAG TPA: carboxymuconolactone decarboxylase family protein [Candidatus Baltobacteraceae bacterium]|jgi:alkylhydroperoxidase family enzyme|nr:carboxymuconolactone decarboxylase family protein [Candidatus Baltobacteraceae bacterium]